MLVPVVLVACVALLWLYFRRCTSYMDNLPCVEPCYPIVGNLMLIIGKNSEQIFEGTRRAFSHPARLFKFMAGIVPVVVSNHPDIAQQILTNPDCLEKAFMYKFFRLDQGLFSAKYDLWKSQRKTLNPSFNQKILHGYIPVFDKHSRELVQSLNELADGKTQHNIAPFMHRLAIKTICATTMGVEFERNSDADRLSELLQRIFHLTFKRLFRFHWNLDWVYRLTKDYKEDMELRLQAYTFGDEILRKAAERHAKELSLSDGSDANNNRKMQIFVDQMLDNFNREEIRDNFYTMIVAGSDTSATQMTYIALALAVYQEYQEKVYQEICSIHPPDEELNITAESLSQLKYTEMFIKESMRILTVGPTFVRKTLKEIELDGIKVPRGSNLIFSAYNLHRRKDIWGPNADQFDPENFSAERSAGRHPYAFIPFSAGNRNCPGYRYAMFNMKTILVHVVRNFKLTTDWRFEDLRFRFEAILKVKQEPEIRLERRAVLS